MIKIIFEEIIKIIILDMEIFVIAYISHSIKNKINEKRVFKMAFGNWEIKEGNKKISIQYNNNTCFGDLDSVNESAESSYENSVINQISELNFDDV